MSILSGIRGIFGGKAANAAPVVDFSAAPKSTNYSTYSKDKLMDCFSTDWGTMGNAQRESLLREVSARYASEQGVSTPAVTLNGSMNTGNMGSYSSGAIELNPKYLDNPYEALDTIVHETNHHVQAEHVKANAGDTKDNLALFACESAKGGYSNGSGGGDDRIYYDMQSLEMDSNNAGFAVLAENYDRFKSDPQYLSYLKGREQHFRELENLYDSNQEKWKDMEKAHIEAARKNGISDALCDRAIKSVEYGPDEAKQKAFKNAKTAKELYQNCRAEQENAQSVGTEATGTGVTDVKEIGAEETGAAQTTDTGHTGGFLRKGSDAEESSNDEKTNDEKTNDGKTNDEKTNDEKKDDEKKDDEKKDDEKKDDEKKDDEKKDDEKKDDEKKDDEKKDDEKKDDEKKDDEKKDDEKKDDEKTDDEKTDDQKKTAEKEQANGINDEKTTNNEKETAEKEQANGINDEKTTSNEKETAEKEQANGINDEKTTNNEKETAEKEQANGINGEDSGTSSGKGESEEITQ